VYNGAATIRRALDSLLTQSYTDFELIISDNASTDGTSEICAEYAARDSRIRYVRQPENCGAVRNFKFVLEAASAPFFMWAAHDDIWEPDYVAANLAILQAEPDCVCSVSRVCFIDDEGRAVEADAGTRPLTGPAEANLLAYMHNPASNSRFYGLFRRTPLLASYRETESYWALDWVVMARTLHYGKHHEVQRCLLHRRKDVDTENSLAKRLPRFNHTFLGRLFPMLPMTIAIWSDPVVPRSLKLFFILCRWNVHRFVKYHFYIPLRKFQGKLKIGRHGRRPRSGAPLVAK
jgi:glycosyltransferase involved in cell wall biosynthesis